MSQHYKAIEGKPDFIDVMIDIETLGTEPGFVILAIGAVVMMGELPSSYFKTISISSQPYAHISSASLEWWNEKDVKLKDKIFSGKETIKEVLKDFAETLNNLEATPIVWGNAASFDISILEHAYKQHGIPVPWHYRNVMCFRTLKNIGWQTPKPKFIGTEHNPEDDAINQLRWLQAIKKDLGV